MYKTIPAVFAVDDTYQIMVRTEQNSLMWVKVGEHCYYDHSNGILRSDTKIHRVTVPASTLDSCSSYTVFERPVIERKPYFSETGEVKESTYEFRPVTGDNIRAYHIADAHNMIDAPERAARAYGDFDFLILNGDIPDHSGTCGNFDNIYELCGRLTHGNIPIVFSRGNHDMRGVCAEKLTDYTPTANGKSYFTVRLGGFWGLILDCGEDKPDTHPEYGSTVCCHAFRGEETEFINKVIEENKYSAPGITCRAVIVHDPFNRKHKEPFNIENDIYNTWTRLLKDHIKPDIMICGHEHKIALDMPGGDEDYRGQPCPVAIMSETDYKDHFAGAGFEFFKDGKIEITVTDSDGNTKNIFKLN